MCLGRAAVRSSCGRDRFVLRVIKCCKEFADLRNLVQLVSESVTAGLPGLPIPSAAATTSSAISRPSSAASPGKSVIVRLDWGRLWDKVGFVVFVFDVEDAVMKG